MSETFDYDPDEMISFEGHDITLREAVHRYRSEKERSVPLVDFTAYRDFDKVPREFSIEDFEYFLGRPEFKEE
ncbi:hypothetical protein [Methylovirgula sp. 4M-Z18]|uniref:hypothetical protein n=1 Tax=Methylovirgula sp. 4M-Z18 TaxID=2293567 RepID=UPI000E2E8866|nr:hypothetical protein [Methylovirgula sp. 4M-Z18]RFB79706.1 hypothetical protein DYH55_09520 [Methylovirgula sp. 4M-Z18]